jgi:hypothetical protein
VLVKADTVIARPHKDKIEAFLRKTGMHKKDIKCSICDKPISDLKQIRAIFPYHSVRAYHSALISCDKIECLITCRNKMIAENSR